MFPDAPPAHIKSMRLLLVEDDARLADMLQRSLREEGYAVDLAEDCDRAYYQARVNEYDGIVLDSAFRKRMVWR